MKKRVAILGATGMIGEPVTHQLISDGFEVTILARNIEKAKKIFPETPIIEADVFDPLSLIKAFEGQEIIYISLSPSRTATKNSRMPEAEGIDNIVEAAKDCGVKRLALLSSLVQRYEGMNGFHWWIFEMKNKAAERIKKSGIPFSIFYPSSFMETILRDIIQGGRLMLTTGSVAKMFFISAKDYAKQVSKALSIAGKNNQEYAIQGKNAYNWYEAADIVIKNAKKKPGKLKAPMGVLRVMGYIIPMVNYGWHICEALNKYPEKFESEQTWKDLGEPQITLAEFIKNSDL